MTRLHWMKGLFGVALAVIHVSCALDAPQQQNLTAQLRINARTVVGEPLVGVVVRTQGAVQREWLTDSFGVVVIESRVGREDLQIDASCPDEFVGQAVQRRIPSPVLAGMVTKEGQWSLDLVCQPQNPQLPVAVLSEGCGEVKVSLGDEALGATKSGAFHALIALPHRSSLEINVESMDKRCEVTEPIRTVTLDMPTPSVFLRVASRATPVPRIRRSAPKTEKTSKRPYRL